MKKIGIIGTGTIGVLQMKALDNIDGFEIGCLCDLNEESVKALSEQMGVPYFLNYKEIPEKIKLDAVIINLPHFLHCEATVFFLDAGVNVFVEKPMANTVAECDRMIEAAEKNGRILAVGHIQRYYEANRKIHDLIKSGILGKFCMSTEQRSVFYFNDKRPRWFLDKNKAGGGIVMNYGAHALDKHSYILGERVVEAISCYGNLLNDFNVEGHAQFMAKFENGGSMAVTFSACSPAIYDDVYYFTKGAVRCVNNSTFELNITGQPKEVFEIKDDGKAMERELLDFLNLLEGRPSEIPDGIYGREIISAIEKVFNNKF